MIFDCLGMWFLDGGIAAVFNSPFVIPVAGCVMVACIVVSSMWAGVRSQEIKSHERLAKIAQGLPVEPSWDEVTVKAATAGEVGEDPPGFSGYKKLKQYQQHTKRADDGAGARRAGLILVSIGVGLLAFFGALAVIVQVREVLAGGAAGLIPLAIGVGFLIDARLKKQEYERRLAAGWYPGPDVGSGAGQASAPPPPGMTEAQASDWRPLH